MKRLLRLLRDIRIAIDAGRAEFHRRRYISKRTEQIVKELPF